MSERPIDELHRSWRAAESRGDDAAADAALAALVQTLPLEAPSPRFAAGVLARLASRPAPAPAPAPAEAPAAARAASPVSRAARRAAALLALLSAGTLALASATVTVLPRLDLGAGVRAFNGVMAALWGWMAGGLALWLRAAEWSALMARLVAVPEIAWSLLGAALAAALSFYLLQRILAHEGKLLRAPRH